MRRALTVILLLAIAAAAAWTLWKWKPDVLGAADPWNAIPSEAAVIIEVPNVLTTWDRFAHTSLLWRDWEREPGARRLSAAMSSLLRKLDEDSLLRGSLGDPDLLVALIRSGHSAQPVFVTSPGTAASRERIGSLLGISAQQVQQLASGASVTCEGDSAWTGLSLCARDGLWILSPSRDALDEALLQLERGTPIMADAGFANARATLGAATDAHVILHTGRVQGLLSSIWEAGAIDRLTLPVGWLALDLSAKPDAMLLNGLFVKEGDSDAFDLFASQETGPWDIGRVLPAEAVQWEVRNVGSPESLAARFAAMDDRTRGTEAATEWMRGEVCIARTADGTQRWFIAETSDPDLAMEALLTACAKDPCDTVGYRGVRLTHTPSQQSHETLLGLSQELPQQPWWAVLGNHVVMSDDPNAVRRCIDVWNDGGSLAEDHRAKSWFRRMSDEAGFTWWCDLAKGGIILKENLRPDRIDGFAQWMPVLGALGGLSIQLSPADASRAHVTIGLQHAPIDGAPQPVATGGALWSCPIGAPVLRRPELVRNHTNGTLEVLVQDSLHRLHLISATGKLLWSRQLDGPILGPVHQVDRFKNGKLQLLLGTARTLHQIDRNGKDVGVPYKLPAAASAPLSVFDYESTRDYRVVIGLIDGRLLNLDLDWAAVKGWDAPRSDTPVIAPVHHLRIAGKDHLLAITGDGSMKPLDRRGQVRQAIPARLDRVKEVLAVTAGPQLMATKVTWIDQDLSMHETTLSGNSSEDSGTLQRRDADGDGQPETIDETTAAMPSGIAVAYPLGPDSMAIGRADAITGKAWRLNAVKGSAPYGGASVIGDLNLDGTRELIGGGASGTISANRMP